MDPAWIQFALSAIGVIIAGVFIGRVSGELGERLQLGRAWSGAVLLSLATTLPELVATVTVAMHGEVGLALGCVLGSMIFNVFILVFVDIFGTEPFYHKVSFTHIATGVLGCALLGLMISGIALGNAQPAGWKGIGIGHVGITSLVILVLYILGQYALFRLAKSSYSKESAMELSTGLDRFSLVSIIMIYLCLAGVIVIAAYHLGLSVEVLAKRYPLGATFAGATLLGIVTSLPEVTNAITCARQKEFNLAVGNVLGANAFVLIVLVVADFCYWDGYLFAALTSMEAMSSIAMAGMAIAMQAIVLGAVAVRSVDRIFRLSVVSVLLTVLYFSSLFVAYLFRE